MESCHSLTKEQLRERYLWKGLDLDRYDVIYIYPVTMQYGVIIMRSKKRESHPYCVEYKGNGHYFRKYRELTSYCRRRKLTLKKGRKV